MEAARPDDAAPSVAELAAAASRLDELAEVAELMGDDEGAVRFRAEGSRRREQAMVLLDGDPPPPGAA